LDHVSGLTLNSADDTKKPVFSNPPTIDYLNEFLFNWDIWPNAGYSGESPYLDIYNFTSVPEAVVTPISNTPYTIELHNVTHTVPTSAFLLNNQYNEYLLLFGDCEADSVSNKTTMKTIWQRVAPLVRDNQLNGIFIESSYDDSRPSNQLFGHMSPKYVIQELTNLANEVANLTGGSVNTSIAGLSVVILHIKPLFTNGTDIRTLIQSELNAQNTLGVNFYLPTQGQSFTLSLNSLVEDKSENITTTISQIAICVICPISNFVCPPTQIACKDICQTTPCHKDAGTYLFASIFGILLSIVFNFQ